MIYIKQLLLVFIGLSSGGIVAAGVFAFITAIGVMTRLAAKTRTAEKVHFYEVSIILGGTIGNLWDIYKFPLFGGYFFMVPFGLCVGIFIGCLVMSLAETLDVLPTITRRIGLAVGIQYVILGIALGKCVGALLYFYYNWS